MFEFKAICFTLGISLATFTSFGMSCFIVQQLTNVFSSFQSFYDWFLLCHPEVRKQSTCGLVAPMVKNPPAMQETWVWSLGWEDPLEEGMATHSNIPAGRIPMDRGAWRATVQSMGLQRVGHDRATKKTHMNTIWTWLFRFCAGLPAMEECV